MARVRSVNVGVARESRYTDAGVTGIDKRPVGHPVAVLDPGPRGTGASGLSGDAVCDLRHHGGSDHAVYAYAREDLDDWQELLGRALPCGAFGENLTTEGVDLDDARIGERWRVGGELVLEVADPRIPCRTFAGFLGERDWVRRFTVKATAGAHLRVVVPGAVCAGDPIEVISRPSHDVTVRLVFRAFTLEPELLPRLLEAGETLTAERRAHIDRVVGSTG